MKMSAMRIMWQLRLMFCVEKYLWTRLNNRLLYSMSDYFYVLVTVVRKNIRYVNIGKYTKLKY